MSNDTPDWYQVSAQGQTLLTTITTTGDGLAHSQTITLPSSATTQAVAVRARTTGGNFVPTDARIAGDVTSTVYVVLQAANTNAGSQVERWFLPDLKAVCTVTDQGVGKPASVDFIALNFGPVTTVRTDPNGPSLSVIEPNAQVWQGPGLLPIDVTSALAAGASQTVISAGAGLIVRVFTIQGTFDSAEAGVDYAVEDGSTIRGRLSLVSIGPHFQDWHGAPMNTGNALVIKNEGTATHVLRGTLTASQGTT